MKVFCSWNRITDKVKSRFRFSIHSHIPIIHNAWVSYKLTSHFAIQSCMPLPHPSNPTKSIVSGDKAFTTLSITACTKHVPKSLAC